MRSSRRCATTASIRSGSIASTSSDCSRRAARDVWRYHSRSWSRRRSRPTASSLNGDAMDSKRRVLIIEDNADLLAILEQLLSADYHVATARRGEEGVTLATSFR